MESVMTSESSNDPETKSNSIRISAALAPKFNLTFFQNSIPILLELAVVNDSDRNLSKWQD